MRLRPIGPGLQTVLIFALLATFAGGSQANPVFINEIHYDNDGGDVGEFVEIAGAAGTDLTDWTLVLYNGSPSQLSPYNTEPLSGILADDTGTGFGFQQYVISSIQNGSPDGLALVDNIGNVVEFLSYEGTFTAASGPANGLTSTDIGVFEPGDTPVGQSLQLTGTGSVASDFTWAGPDSETPNAINNGQTFAGSSTLINEDFEVSCPGSLPAGWQQFSVDSDNSGAGKTWGCESFGGDKFAEVNAFDNGASGVAAEDWLITPEFVAGVGDVLSFVSASNFLPDAGQSQPLTVQYSTNYGGSGDPTGATWTEFSGVNLSTGGFNDVDSGELDLSAVVGVGAYVAFVYRSSGTGPGSSTLWQIDDVRVGASGVMPGTDKLISEIQGTGAVSPEVGNTVTIEAIVTADFQDSVDSDYNGFFLQEEDSDADGLPETSEGIFVFQGNASVTVPDVSVGDRVMLTGIVDEFDGETQIDTVSAITIVSSGQPLPTPATLASDANFFLVPDTTTNSDNHIIADYERYEGMRVTIPEPLTVGDLFTLGRYNEVGLTAGGRIPNFTQVNAPDIAGYAQFQQDAARRALVIDDAFDNAQNRDPIFPQGGGLNADTPTVLRSGDTVAGLTGVIAYREPPFDSFNYRLIPTEEPMFMQDNPRPDVPPSVDGSLTVVSFNVLNFFTTIDTNVGNFNGPDITGPAADQEPRGAEFEAGELTVDPDGLDEFDRQRAKLVAAIAAIDADIVGLIEIENDPNGTDSLSNLTDALNAVSTRSYSFVDAGPIEGDPTNGAVEGDAIKVGLLYDTDTVAEAGALAILDQSVDPDFQTVGIQRPALAQSFEENASGEVFTVVVNHFKSKGSVVNNENAIGDGQANNNPTRTAAAEALVDWLATDPTGSNDDDVLIIGDLNAYLQEDPIQAILDGADGTRGTDDDYLSLVAGDDYTFGFPIGLDTVPQVQTFGTLDYALANTSLHDQVAGAAIWHINADEPSVLDYNLNFKPTNQQGTLYAPDAFRASDHDPVIVGLDLSTANVAPTADAGADQTVDDVDAAGNPTVVTLDGSGSTDSDGTIVSYAWVQVGRTTVTLSDPSAVSPTFEAPDAGPLGETLTFELTVTDDEGATDSASVVINIEDASAGDTGVEVVIQNIVSPVDSFAQNTTCANVSAGQNAQFRTDGILRFALDCAPGGVTFAPGEIAIIGFQGRSAASERFGLELQGRVSGLVQPAVTCWSLLPFQRVEVMPDAMGNWNCSSAGFTGNPSTIITIFGIAQ